MIERVNAYDIKNHYFWKTPMADIHEAYKMLAETPENHKQLMETAIDFRDANAIQILFDAGYDPASVDDLNFTLLHQLARKGNTFEVPEGAMTACVNLLLDNKVSALKKDTNEGFCCYHYAARNAEVEYVRAMRARGVKLDMAGKKGNTALHELVDYFGANGCERPEKAAEAQKYIDTAIEFIEAGVDVDAKNEYGWNAGKIVVDRKAAPLFKLLVVDPNVFMAIEMKAYDFIGELAAPDPNTIRHEEYARFDKLTALGAACVVSDPKMVEILFSVGADANFKNDSGDTALVALLNTNNPGYDSLRENHYAKILDMFAAHGWDKNSEIDAAGNTLLTAAIKKNFSSSGYNNFSAEGHIINWLLKNNADINKPNAAGQTPIMLACVGSDSDMEAVQLSLLENGVDISPRDLSGKTALHYCAMNRSNSLGKTMADLLFAFGKIDTSIVDNDGKTALDIATENNNEELVKFILSKV